MPEHRGRRAEPAVWPDLEGAERDELLDLVLIDALAGTALESGTVEIFGVLRQPRCENSTLHGVFGGRGVLRNARQHPLDRGQCVAVLLERPDEIEAHP